MSLNITIDSNINTLVTAKGIVAGLSEEQYGRICEPFFDSSIGQHIRHILDHYICFFAGLHDGYINYDNRQRNNLIEIKTAHALRVLDEMLEKLQAPDLAIEDRPLLVELCTTTKPVNENPAQSFLTRELVFLHSHATHHFALIAAMMTILGLPVDKRFGVAASTQVYKEQQLCAQ